MHFPNIRWKISLFSFKHTTRGIRTQTLQTCLTMEAHFDSFHRLNTRLSFDFEAKILSISLHTLLKCFSKCFDLLMKLWLTLKFGSPMCYAIGKKSTKRVLLELNCVKFTLKCWLKFNR